MTSRRKKELTKNFFMKLILKLVFETDPCRSNGKDGKGLPALLSSSQNKFSLYPQQKNWKPHRLLELRQGSGTAINLKTPDCIGTEPNFSLGPRRVQDKHGKEK